MIPHDGMGYGRSLYWEMKARRIAKKNHEYCSCWDINNPKIEMAQDGSYRVIVKCHSSIATCPSVFEKTNEKMTVLFKNFYKGYTYAV